MHQRETKAERTRRRLLDAAAAVVSRRGYSGTRLVDIAAEADIQAPAIYYHYGSREELIEEVMFRGATAMHSHLTERLTELADATATERIAAAVDAHLRLELEISDYSTAIIRNANQLPAAVSERALAMVSEYNAIWRQLLDDLAADAGLADDLDPSVARMLVLGALNWAVEWYRPGGGTLETVIQTAQSMVLRGLGAEPGPATAHDASGLEWDGSLAEGSTGGR